MTDEQRKSVALEYLRAFDNAGVTSTGESILELFAPDAQVMFPKWGLANGREEIGNMFGAVGETLKSIRHDYDVQLDLPGGGPGRLRGNQLRRAPGRPVAGGGSRVGRGTLV